MPQALGLAGLTRFMSQRGWSGVSTVRGCVGELPCLNAWRALGRRTECLSLVGGRKGFGFEFSGPLSPSAPLHVGLRVRPVDGPL